MTMNSKYAFSTMLGAAIYATTAAFALAQGGPLTPPPGPPEPTMKSLDLVEPRIPLVEGASGVTVALDGKITINQSGSYYLTANLNAYDFGNAITINASGVTLDLMGHSIIAATPNPTLGAGIAVTANRSDVTITNGHIVSYSTYSGSTFLPAGFERGVSFDDDCSNAKVSDVSVSGVRSHGIYMSTGFAGLVEDCAVSTTGGSGIIIVDGSVLGCVVQAPGESGIQGGQVVDNCRVRQARGAGISGSVVSNSFADCHSGTNHAINAGTVQNSTGSSIGGHGIFAIMVQNSYGSTAAFGAGLHGIYSPNGQVSGSYGSANGGHGISADSVSHSSGSSSGIHGSSSCGIFASTVNGSTGRASGLDGGHGISSNIVTGSDGYVSAVAGDGINTWICESSSGSRASAAAGKYGIVANRASLCSAFNGENITHRYNMP